MFRSTGDSESRPIPLFANSYGTVCKLHEKPKNSQTGIDKSSVFYETFVKDILWNLLLDKINELW